MARKAKSSKKGTNDNLLRASKQKTKKIERIGLHREDGKAFKQVSERSERALRKRAKTNPPTLFRSGLWFFRIV